MKLYSIWWEEEILLMCSCNDCSKEGGNERERRTAACIWIPWKKSKLWKHIFLYFSALPWSEMVSSYSELTVLQTKSPTDFGNIKLFWLQEASGVMALWFWRMFYQHGLWVQLSAKIEGGREAATEPVCLIHLQLIRHRNMASTDLVVFPERNNEELL